MKKISLLAASVALALVGCGGSDGDSNTNTGTPSAGGIVITGFDGYFKNAVVFDDMPVATRTSTLGKLDANDIIFGLTDEHGKITLPKNTVIKGTLSLQTITPNGEVQTMLIDRDPSKFAGVYTIDMDHPTQAMTHEVAFRTLKGEKIISPLTDLVAVEAGTNPTPEKIQEAKEKVNKALGLDAKSTVAFSDVIAAGDHALHKTAQILTESKVEAGANYTPTAAIAIAEKATVIVNASENADKLDKPNFKPTIPVSEDGIAGEAIINNKLVVSKTIYDNLIKQVNATDTFTDVTEISLIDLPIAELFVDTDNKDDITPTVKITTKDSVDVTADFEITKTATELTISAKDSITTVRNIYIVTLSATDIAANKKNMGIVSTTFEIKVELENAAPTLNPQVRNTLQEWLGSLELQQNVAVFNEKMRISELFADDQDKLTYKAYSSVVGLAFSFPPFLDGGTELEILGKPSHAYPAGETITISATDGINTVYANFTLAAIAEAGITINETKYAALQEKITDITLKQNTPVAEAQLDITELFNTESVNGLGAIEYYAGLEDKAPAPNGDNLHEYFTTVDGVKVNVDTNGILTISGKPSTVIKGGYFYVAAGINADAEDAIISEYVKITLPDVKPADEVTPPPQPGNNVSMENMFLYESAVESLDEENNNYLGSGVSCEVRYFMSDGENTGTGEMFSFTRTAASFDKCPTIDRDTQPTIENGFESFGKYKVNSNHVISLQIEDEYYDDSGNSFMGKGDINISAKMFDKKFITTLQEKITPPAGYDDAVYTWKSLYAASTTPNSANAIMAEWHKLEDDSVNQLENTIYFTDESGNIQPLRVDATMNSVDQDCTEMSEKGKADADIYIKNMSCELVEKVYSFNGYSISENPISWGNGDDTTNINFYPQGDSCGVDFSSYSDISLGIHTLHGEVKEAFQGKYQDIMFSFKKD